MYKMSRLLKKYTLEEIASHNSLQSLWIIVDTLVYDVTKFKHPGGQNPFLKYAGRDCTKKFKTIIKHNESFIIEDVMKSLCIGKVK